MPEIVVLLWDRSLTGKERPILFRKVQMDLIFKMVVPKQPNKDGIYYCVAYDSNDKPVPDEHQRATSAIEAFAYASMITGNGRVSSPAEWSETHWVWERKT